MPNDNAKADVDISVTDELDAADAAVISDGLRAHYVSQAGYYDFRPLAVFVRDRQTGGSSAGPRAIRIWARLRRLVLPARGSAPRSNRQPGSGNGGRRGQTTRLHSDRVDDAQHRGARLLPETGLRCRGHNRLRAAWPHALLHAEKALINGLRLARYAEA